MLVLQQGLRHWAIFSRGVVDLFAGNRPAGDEVVQRLLGERAWMPLTFITGLALLRRIDAEQPHELRPE